MEYHISNIGLINSIDRQIEELQRRKEALQMGYCYIPGLYKAETYGDLNIRLLDKEEK